MKFLKHRIGDERVLRLIVRMLKSGIMEDGLARASDEGVPQGGNLSPLLSNVYLHYALDLWFERRFKQTCRGAANYFRFADDGRSPLGFLSLRCYYIGVGSTSKERPCGTR